MRSIALGLDLNERFFDKKIDEKCHNLRLLSYPPIKRALLANDGQARAGAHSGMPARVGLLPFYGSLTNFYPRLRHVDFAVPRSSRRPGGAESAHQHFHSRYTGGASSFFMFPCGEPLN